MRFWVLLGLIGMIAVADCAGEERAGSRDEDAAAVLIRRCLECHSGLEPAGKLDLAQRETALRGGESGRAIVPSEPEKSLLWQRVAAGEMPPKTKLTEAEKQTLQRWISEGAVWGKQPLDRFRFSTDSRAGYDWWALQPLKADAASNRSIDSLIASELALHGLQPSPPADRRTLIRRLSFDLLGLPPEPEEVAAFLADDRPDAYEQLVDRLLASPHYGMAGIGWMPSALAKVRASNATRFAITPGPIAIGSSMRSMPICPTASLPSCTRLDAESLRDTMLAVAGQLNSQMGGPGYRDFTTYVHNTQFYQMLNPVGPEFQRRTIYRTWIRSGRSGLLDAFDCPDPSTKTPRRAVTVTPLQALALQNNSFVLRMSQHFAQRLQREAGDSADARIRRAYQLCYARDPADAELAALAPFVERHGAAELCRVLFNSNEFLYVD